MGKRPSDYDLLAKETIEGMIGGGRKSVSKEDFNLAKRAHGLRSPRARGVDEGTSGNMVFTFDEWASDPARNDIQGVDSKRPKAKRGKKRR